MFGDDQIDDDELPDARDLYGFENPADNDEAAVDDVLKAIENFGG